MNTVPFFRPWFSVMIAVLLFLTPIWIYWQYRRQRERSPYTKSGFIWATTMFELGLTTILLLIFATNDFPSINWTLITLAGCLSAVVILVGLRVSWLAGSELVWR